MQDISILILYAGEDHVMSCMQLISDRVNLLYTSACMLRDLNTCQHENGRRPKRGRLSAHDIILYKTSTT